MVSTTFVAAALSTLPLAFAYYPTANGTATPIRPPPPAGTGAGKPVQTVTVGQNGLTFTPDTIYAKDGEEVVFEFFPKNHTVVQADFKKPCEPIPGRGIFSGFRFNTTEGKAVRFSRSRRSSGY
jgi:plastocyanin